MPVNHIFPTQRLLKQESKGNLGYKVMDIRDGAMSHNAFKRMG